MISTSLMIKLGKIKGNKMVDMQLTNDKLLERGAKMVAMETKLDPNSAKTYLLKHGSVRLAVNAFKSGK
jgi:N-acetylmuramic acid 6-phosphate etherase